MNARMDDDDEQRNYSDCESIVELAFLSSHAWNFVNDENKCTSFLENCQQRVELDIFSSHENITADYQRAIMVAFLCGYFPSE